MVVAPGDAVVLHGLPSFQGFNGRRRGPRVRGLVADHGHVKPTPLYGSSPLKQ